MGIDWNDLVSITHWKEAVMKKNTKWRRVYMTPEEEAADAAAPRKIGRKKVFRITCEDRLTGVKRSSRDIPLSKVKETAGELCNYIDDVVYKPR